ncbi:hypothetical protein [Streptomyces iconiensis]|uniref:DUF3592 domain-containing protein n=1 Tax=Streptomyces iconiensis TaxID=1384038 RepID=A0ABT7A0W1_9ACTN|nr:hypothetical protein [Streptomyces iconiensis]MDJ1134973.1 hypothetical protein [Streptomyces iconiensis]
MRLSGGAVLGACVMGVALAALVQGVAGGALWLLVFGITLLSAVLAAIGKAAEMAAKGFAAGLRSPARPRAYAPALVNGAKTVHKETGRAVADGRAQKRVFVFDLTVVPDDGVPFRAKVAHPLDLQGLMTSKRAVVEYDPRQRWRVVLPADPPEEWRARAARLAFTGPPPEPLAARFPPGAQILVLGLLLGALFVVASRAVV